MLVATTLKIIAVIPYCISITHYYYIMRFILCQYAITNECMLA